MPNTVDKRYINDAGFYQKLTPFDDFNNVTDLAYYTPLPDDWVIVMADIRGSTKAITEGRYKDVNMMGAGCIAAILNVTRDFEIPYVFGGDGATLAVPKSTLPRVRGALLGAQYISKTQFGLELRIGAVPIEDLRELNLDILVAKYKLSAGNYLAMFSGGGVEKVDQLIKDAPPSKGYRFIPSTGKEEAADLNGLSCRWEPLKSKNGQMLSLLVQAQGAQGQELQKTYDRTIRGIAKIIGEGSDTGSPISKSNMKFNWPPKGLRSEIRATGASPLKLYKESFIQWILEKFNLSAGGYHAPGYRRELRTNSDFRRFDDMLRLVLDCTVDQVSDIDSFLSTLHQKGQIIYGIHTADSALMTCLVFNLTQSEHVHFIDGADGGFALAATQLKAQLKMLKS